MMTEKKKPTKKIGCKLDSVKWLIQDRPKPTIEELIQKIVRGESNERTHSAIDLIEFGESALPQTINLLKTGSNSSKQIAAWVLGEIGGEKAKKALEEYKDNPNKHIRMAVGIALDDIESN